MGDKNTIRCKEVVTAALNCGLDFRLFLSLMAKEHRTLQAYFSTLCFRWIEKAAQQWRDRDYDPRNEDECRQASEMLEGYERVRKERGVV